MLFVLVWFTIQICAQNLFVFFATFTLGAASLSDDSSDSFLVLSRLSGNGLAQIHRADLDTQRQQRHSVFGWFLRKLYVRQHF